MNEKEKELFENLIAVPPAIWGRSPLPFRRFPASGIIMFPKEESPFSRRFMRKGSASIPLMLLPVRIRSAFGIAPAAQAADNVRSAAERVVFGKPGAKKTAAFQGPSRRRKMRKIRSCLEGGNQDG